MDDNIIYRTKIMFTKITHVSQLSSSSIDMIHGEDFLLCCLLSKKKPTFKVALEFLSNLDGKVTASPKFKDP